MTSLVDDVIEDWNAYNECKDREEALVKKTFKPNAVESWVHNVSKHSFRFQNNFLLRNSVSMFRV